MTSPPLTAPVIRASSIDASEATSRILHCLGVVLLDLVCKARLEDSRGQVNSPRENHGILQQTALPLGGRIWKEIGPDCAHAV